MSKIYEALQLEQNNQRKAYLQTEIHPVKPTYNDAIVWRNGNPEIEEEFINLYYTVHSLLGQKNGKVVQFISSMKGDGTSTISEQFGRVSTSGLGKSVLLIKTDGNGHDSHLSGMEESDAHLERLGNGASAEEMFSHHGEPCFVVWSLSNPVSAQTVRSPERFETVLSKLRDHFDLILVDMPALSSSPLGLAVCALADGVIIVIEAEKTKSMSAEKAKQRIQRAGGNILGVVFNKHRSHIPAGIAQL